MANIFFTCLQCGKHLKAGKKTIANNVLKHKCENKFDLVQFQMGIEMLQEEQKLKSVSQALPQPPPPPPPPPPKMPSAPLYIEKKCTVTLSRDKKG